MAIKLIIGLGNPGSAYEHTRHNAGAWFAAELAQRHDGRFKFDKKMQAELCDIEVAHYACKIAIPSTFMNHSGQSTRAISHFYRIQADEVLVAHDDLDLPTGSIRLKTAGGHGGHNGLKDIMAHLGGAHFHRLRIGIGHPGNKDMVHSYVLNKPSVSDKQLILDAIDRGVDIMPLVLAGDLARAMNQLNT